MTTDSDFEQTRDLLAHVGMTLTQVQLTERLINQTLLFVFQEGDGLDLEAYNEQKRFLERKTLGQMVAKLKERVRVHDQLEELMAAFVRDRNTLAHDLSRIDGYDLNTEPGRAAVNAFLRSLFDNSTKVMKIFMSINLSWQEQTGFSTPVDMKIREFAGEEYLTIADFLFHEKKTTPE